MAGIAADRRHARHDLAHKGLTGHGDADRTAPGMRDLDVPKRRVDLGDLPTNMLCYVARIVGRIGFAPAEEQSPVLGLAEVAHDEARVGHGLAAWQHLRMR